jgi:hypothetical protein
MNKKTKKAKQVTKIVQLKVRTDVKSGMVEIGSIVEAPAFDYVSNDDKKNLKF